MTSFELEELAALIRVEGWDGKEADLRAGQICATIANVAPFRKNHQSYSPADFFGTLDHGPIRVQTAEEQKAMFDRIAGKWG